MNRAQKRAEEAKAKMAANASRVKTIVQEANTVADEADRLKAMLFSLAREHGRLRIKASHLAALTENDRVDFLHQENGDVIVQYTQGAK
jgi:hypothetical protein